MWDVVPDGSQSDDRHQNLPKKRSIHGKISPLISSAQSSTHPNPEDESISKRPRLDTPLTPRSPSTPSDPRPLVYACTWENCDRVFSRPCRLEEHVRSHTGERPFQCDEDGCGKTFVRDYHLSRHKKISHAHDRPHHCSHKGCGLGFATPQRLRLHEQTHEKTNEYRCRDYAPCSELFRKKSTLQAHINSVHLGLEPYICNYIDVETGQACDKGFQSMASLNYHATSSHGPPRFACTICIPEALDPPQTEVTVLDVTPASPASMSTQISIMSSVFRTSHELQRHVQEQHPDQAPVKLNLRNKEHECEQCGDVFSSKFNLDHHILVVHKKIKRFICGEIDLSSSKHLLGPDGERMWDGKGCGKAVTSKSVLEDHVRVEHLSLPSKQTARQQKKRDRRPLPGGGNQKAKTLHPASLLLGQGLEDDGRDIHCLIHDCDNIFFRDYDLIVHCTAVHDMEQSDAPERLMEREALQGGQFWYGGIDPTVERQTNDENQFNEGMMNVDDPMLVDPDLEQMDISVDAVRRM